MPLKPEDLTPTERQFYDALPPSQQHTYLDLSDEVRPLIGRWSPAGACSDDQRDAGVCVPDPRVTSQVGVRKPVDWDLVPADSRHGERIHPYRIKDAHTGDLMLSPGGPSGVIGALLSALAPPQDYSHMGIVVADDGFNGTVLRHCTASEDWMMRAQFTTGTIFAGTPLEMKIPERGFRPDAERFVWPGTLTQTVEVAYKSHYHELYRREVYEHDAAGHYLLTKGDNGEPERILRDKYAVEDPVRDGDDRATGGRYRIAALTFDPVVVPEKDGTPEHLAAPLIVQPCPQKRSPAVRAALERVADACDRLRGHYRFYAYTDGQVGNLDDGPPTLERETEPHCVAGSLVTEPLTTTRGMVCSTFIWQAVQLANEDGLPRIFLDGRPHRPEPPDAHDDQCAQRTAMLGRRRATGSQLDPVNPVDGLYFYDSAIRGSAGEALRSKLRDHVLEKIKGTLDDVTGPPVLGAAEGAWAGVEFSWMLGVNPVYLAVLLGTSKAYLDAQIEKIRQTAVHVSNQSGQTFGHDDASLDNESEDWLDNPGTGNTVSPDDILNAWSAPHYEDGETIVGLYGANARVDVLPPAPVDGPWHPSTWEIATDRTEVGVRVFRRDANGDPEFLPVAVVRIGCTELTTREAQDMSEPQYTVCPLGQYFAAATWTDPTSGFQWRSPRQIVEVPGPTIDIEVVPPRETDRVVRLHGTASLLNRHATDELPVIGTDPWTADEKFFSEPIPMSLAFDAVDPLDDPEFHDWLVAQHGDTIQGLREQTWTHDFAIEDWGIVRLRCTSVLADDGSVTVTIKGGTREGQDAYDPTEPDWGGAVVRTAPARRAGDPPTELDLTVERTGFAVPPVRATIHVVIENDQQVG